MFFKKLKENLKHREQIIFYSKKLANECKDCFDKVIDELEENSKQYKISDLEILYNRLLGIKLDAMILRDTPKPK